MKKNILCISHDAHLTGAPLLLLNLIKLLLDTGNYRIRVIVKSAAGPLLQDFSEHCETLIWKKSRPKGLKDKLVNSLLSIGNQNSRKIQQWIDESDFVISNTITNGDILNAFNFSKVKSVLSYVHELEMATKYYTTKEHVSFVTKVSNHFMVPSNAVAKHLVNNLKIDPKKISTLNYYIPLDTNGQDSIDVNNEAFLIGIAGTLDWRKGADILTVAVAYFFRKYPAANVKFVWQGANKHTIEYERIRLELEKLSLTSRVSIEPPLKDMGLFYRSIDVFLLLSKEDPYPLVVLEAASYNKPSICFDEAGGAPEFVKNDAGDSIAYLNLESLADTIYGYYENRNKMTEKGNVANAKYKALHLNKELILKQFKEALVF